MDVIEKQLSLIDKPKPQLTVRNGFIVCVKCKGQMYVTHDDKHRVASCYQCGKEIILT